ncbi:MAG: 2-amino-4-hydroxy-6-hydroxymethyldihydropteridine diphosphokinase [Salibacteraceae bacterium]
MDNKPDEGKICDQVYLSMGSNIGDRMGLIERALNQLCANYVSVIAKSAYYETHPWKMDTTDLFINACVRVQTSLNPLELLHRIQAVEQSMGRVRSEAYGEYESRKIDIDIVYFDSQILETQNLTIPHPLVQERRFVLRPMSDIAPEFNHPILGFSNKELLARCPDQQKVTPYYAK